MSIRMRIIRDIFGYSLWEIVIPKETGHSDRIDELSKWACKYSVLNNTDEVKNYITHPKIAIIYCAKLGRDKELEEKHNLSNFPLFWISMNYVEHEISYRLGGKKAALEIIVGV